MTIRIIPPGAFAAFAALQEPLPAAHLSHRLDQTITALRKALAGDLPSAAGFSRREAQALPDAEDFSWYKRKLDDLRFLPESTRLAEAAHLLDRLAAAVEGIELNLAATGLSEDDCRQFDAETLAYLRENEPFNLAVAESWAWVAKLKAALASAQRVIARAESNAGNLPAVDYSGKPGKPANTERLEKLYHATIHAEDIMRHGFAASKPADRTGIGNLGAQETVSFTHSLRYAMSLNRFFQFAWQLAHGELSLERALALMGSNVNFYQRPATSPRHRKEATFYDSGKKQDRVRADHAQVALARFVNAYSTSIEYLAVCDAKKLWNNLRKVDRKSVAVIECLVDVEGAEYLAGEYEFRTTPDKVVKVLRRVTT